MNRLFAPMSRSRRLNRRILIAMLAVALLPLAALTALVGAELAAVNQTTVDEAHSTIVADAEQRESSAAIDGAGTVQSVLDSLGTDVAQVAATIDPLVKDSRGAVRPSQPISGGARLLAPGGPAVTLVGSSSPLLRGANSVADPLDGSRPAIATALDALRKRHPVSAVWLYSQSNHQLVETPVVDVASLTTLLENDRIDPVRLLDRQLKAAVATVGGDAAKAPVYPAWSDIDTAAFTSGSSVTLWTALPSNSDLLVGAELSSAAIAGMLPPSVSTLPDAYPVLLSRSGRWLSGGSGAITDFGLASGFEGTPFSAPGVSLQQLTTHNPPIIHATIGGVPRELFTAPVNDVRWTLATVVPTRDLAPAAASLGDGIRNGVRRILLLQLLPLAVVIGVIAVALAALFSRRLVGPVRALTTSAERLAQGHTDEPVPRQGDDEVGLLSEALERMRREINTSREALLAAARELEGRVAERTEELRDRNEELVALNALAATLTRSLDPAELLSGAVEAVRVILPVSAAAGYTMVDDLPKLVTHHPARLGDAADEMAEGVAVAVGGGSLTVRQSSAGRVVAIPVAAGGAPLGALAALVPSSVQVPERIRILLGAVADQVGLALRTARFAEEGRELAVLEERTRLAREIHDTLAQQLTGIVLQLEAAEAMQSRNRGERTRDLVVAAREQARLALQEARRSVWNLRPTPLEAAGLTAAVALEAERFGTRSGIAVTVRNDGVPRALALAPQSEVAVFRILQEALANAGHHSHAHLVEVELRASEGELILSISDDGAGFNVDEEGLDGSTAGSFGLVGMRERARLIGADLQIASRPHGGTRVSVRVPLEAPQPAAASA
ncbi:MAG TPA: histidine kinase [Candidatus Dormibacteraeota bacterium]|nr:histidine kinase [Candidatus Dormibacteraeota bacterium]